MNTKSGRDYMLVVDLVVVVGILVVASRPNGLAITVTAAILSIGAFLYRCAMGVRSYFSTKTDKAVVAARRTLEPKRTPPPVPPVAKSGAAGKSKSWLREQD